MLFGNRAESLQGAGNSLLLSGHISRWFDSYHLLVLPIDATETPTRRWRTDVISSDIQNSPYTAEHNGKELVFLNDKRPVSRFLYFHFVMALVRINAQTSRMAGCLGPVLRAASFPDTRELHTAGHVTRPCHSF
ncbi:hypothetical protein EDB80DRAFT_714379 [Ilyonectria destructans]|nr:hypothetical protein EDB80DRAFT_714379 [Ilyonectria destructans]